MKLGHLNHCTLCGNPFKHKTIYTSGWVDAERTLKEVTLISTHTTCRSLLQKKKKLVQQLIDIEYEIFLKERSSTM